MYIAPTLNKEFTLRGNDGRFMCRIMKDRRLTREVGIEKKKRVINFNPINKGDKYSISVFWSKVYNPIYMCMFWKEFYDFSSSYPLHENCIFFFFFMMQVCFKSNSVEIYACPMGWASFWPLKIYFNHFPYIFLHLSPSSSLALVRLNLLHRINHVSFTLQSHGAIH